MLDHDSLRAFLVLAETLHFGRAAKRIALSPQALSGRIKQLEQALGAPLFVRTTRKVELTPGGRRLVLHAQAIVQQLDACAEVVRSREGLDFELTVGTRFELGLSWLTPALAALRSKRPQRQLHLSFGDAPALLKRVVSGEIDAAVTSSRIEAASVDYAPLHAERYVLVGTPELFQRHRFRTSDDATRVALLDERRDLPLFRYFKDASPPDETWRFSRYEYLGTIGAIRLRVLEGAGVAVLPEYYVREDLRTKRLKQLFSDRELVRDQFRLVWRQHHPLREELEVFASDLRRIPLQ